MLNEHVIKSAIKILRPLLREMEKWIDSGGCIATWGNLQFNKYLFLSAVSLLAKELGLEKVNVVENWANAETIREYHRVASEFLRVASAYLSVA